MSETTLKIGTVIDGRYEVQAWIGAGGFGEVYKARDRRTERTVALKLLLIERIAGRNAAREIARFEREAKLLAALQHPNIVPLIDAGTYEKRLYMVLAFVSGQDLGTLIERNGPLSLAEAQHLMTQVLDALCAAHAQGVVHRDLKPGNIMVTATGGRRNAMVLDFGIAGILSFARAGDYKSLTSEGFPGTPLYMAPEQFSDGSDRLNPGIDVYAWGLIFIECLTGKPAVLGESLLAVIRNQTSHDPIKLPAQVEGTSLGRILARALEKDLHKRYLRPKDALAELDPSTCALSSIDAAVTSDISPSQLGPLHQTGQGGSDNIRLEAVDPEPSRPVGIASIPPTPTSNLEAPRSRTTLVIVVLGIIGLGVLAALAYTLSRPTDEVKPRAQLTAATQELPTGATELTQPLAAPAPDVVELDLSAVELGTAATLAPERLAAFARDAAVLGASGLPRRLKRPKTPPNNPVGTSQDADVASPRPEPDVAAPNPPNDKPDVKPDLPKPPTILDI